MDAMQLKFFQEITRPDDEIIRGQFVFFSPHLLIVDKHFAFVCYSLVLSLSICSRSTSCNIRRETYRE